MAKPLELPVKLQFDLSKLTAREWEKYVSAQGNSDAYECAKIYARIVTACPFGEAADANTYYNLKFVQFDGIRAELIAAIARCNNTPGGIEFDLENFSTSDWEKFNKAIKEGRVSDMVEVYTQLILMCPWGDPKNPDTFLDLNFATEFNRIAVAFNQAVQRYQKK